MKIVHSGAILPVEMTNLFIHKKSHNEKTKL